MTGHGASTNSYHSSPFCLAIMRDRTSPAAMTASVPSRPRWFALPLLALGALGFASAWIVVAVRYDGLFAWLAPLAAADMVLLLAAAGHPPGRVRAGWALLGTMTTVAIADFGIIASQVGLGMGLAPWESALKLGPAYALELARLAWGPSEWGWFAASLVVAWVGGHRRWGAAPRVASQ